MKTQRRSFVVEVKSRGRRSATQPDSIWGNMDLKAFAREAESDAPQLFDPTTEAAPPSQADVMPSEQEPQAQPEPAASLEQISVLPAALVEEQPEKIAPTPPIVETAKRATKTAPRQATRRIREAAADKTVNVSRRTTSVTEAPARIETPTDELVALDAENRRLKARLLEHLRQQNRQLSQMLERFDIT